jgi:tripartite ATP-independent transporter DctM subunit
MDISPTIVGIIGLVILLLFLFSGVPVAYCFIFVGFIGLVILLGPSVTFTLIGTSPFQQAANYTWTLLPLYMLMGSIAGDAGMVQSAYSATLVWFGKLRGGIIYTTIVAGTVFAAICGSYLATDITFTKLAWPEMKRYKYAPELGLGSILVTGTLSSLIPPSVVFVIYAMISQESIGKLFIAGLIPGILQSVLIMVTAGIWITVQKNVAPPGLPTTLSQKVKGSSQIWPLLVLILLVLGGIWAGIFTANEGAGIGCVGALVIGFAQRRYSGKTLMQSLRETSVMAGSIFVLIVTLQIFNTFLAVTQFPQALAQWISSMSLPPIIVLIAILIIYTILGVVLDIFPIFLLTLPIFIPVLAAAGIDLIWFGVLATIVLGLGGISPPVGAPIFIIHNMVKKDGINLRTLYKGCAIFCIPVIVTTVICVALPQVVLWLPNTMIGH